MIKKKTKKTKEEEAAIDGWMDPKVGLTVALPGEHKAMDPRTNFDFFFLTSLRPQGNDQKSKVFTSM